MLQRLSIYNFALIRQLEVEFSGGFNVITGETGAGKSILIDAVNFVIGERASRELLKSGAVKAYVEAAFACARPSAALLERLEEFGLELEDGGLVLARELSATGRSVCRINGAMVPLSVQKAVSDCLIDIHGQHEHQSLLDATRHIDLLDAFGAEPLDAAKADTAASSGRLAQVNKRLLQGFLDESERIRRMDILRYQINEITAAMLQQGEEESLDEERVRLANGERILTVLEECNALLSDDHTGTLQSLRQAARASGEISRFSGEYQIISTRLDSLYYDLEDVYHSLRSARDSFEFDPETQARVEERLDVIHNLKRKYGQDISEILAYGKQAQEELTALESNAAERETLERQRTELEVEYLEAAQRLTRLRKQAAERMEAAILTQLADLELTRARFSVIITHQDRFDANGMDRVEFYLSTNRGEPLKPLQKVASGGETSRIMLALKSILAEVDGIDCLIFDEIDAGVSGRIATVVGEKIASLSRGRQIICVTHLPQIAAMADAHYLVKKTMSDTDTTTSLDRLEEEEHVVEVARIMGLDGASQIALAHAQELIDIGKLRKE